MSSRRVMTIANTDIQVIEHNGERVLTNEQMAQVYECEPRQLVQNFNNNKERFEEGKHFYKLTGKDLEKLRVDNIDLQISHMTRSLILWTRRGAARHCKLLGTDRAWDMFDSLEEHYFNRQEVLQPSYMIENPAERARRWADEMEAKQNEIRALEASNAQHLQQIGELKPKADYTDKILQSKGVVPITAIAKDYGMSGQEMNRLLHSMKVIYKIGGQWLLYSKYHAKGYTHSETVSFYHADGRPDVKMNTKWTQKGRLFLYEMLKKKGILPVIEQDEKAG